MCEQRGSIDKEWERHTWLDNCQSVMTYLNERSCNVETRQGYSLETFLVDYYVADWKEYEKISYSLKAFFGSHKRKRRKVF